MLPDAHTDQMGTTTAPTWLVLLAPVAAVVAAVIAAWTSRVGWRSEQRREHQKWAREQRVAAYVAFLEVVNDMLWLARAEKTKDPGWKPEIEWLESLDRALIRVQLFGSKGVARQALAEVRMLGEGIAVTDSADEETAAKLAEMHAIFALIRRELHIED